MRSKIKFLALLVLLTSHFLPIALAVEKPVYALVLGYNKSSDPQLMDLRFADDDAVKNAALMEERGAKVWLHTELDNDSQRLYPKVSFLPPTLEAFTQSLTTLKQIMAEDRRLGREPILYVFLSGHGDVIQNEGFLYLKGSRLGRRDLLQLLENSRASAQHLIIDACKSYFMVFRRGPGGKRQPLSGALEWKHESLLDHTGVFLSTSSDALSHEWEAYQGGIFSHQLRSALRGAADLDGDRTISYKEAAAFIWNAGRGIPNPKYRSPFFAYQPRDPGLAKVGLWDLKPGATIRVGPEWKGLYYVEDQQGERLIDFHPTRQQILHLMLPERRPLFVRQGQGHAEIRLTDRQLVALGPDSSWQVRSSYVRGAEHEAFSQLFSEAFDDRALEGFESELRQLVERPRQIETENSLRTAVGVIAGLGALSSLLAESQVWQAQRSISSHTSMEDAAQSHRRIKNLRRQSTWSAGLALLGGGAYVLWPLWSESHLMIVPNLLEPQLSVQTQF